MPHSASAHPEQAAILAPLFRVQPGKVWAIDLNAAESEISRWRSGQRPASLDDLAAIVRVVRRYGREDLLAELRLAMLAALDLAEEVTPAPSDPIHAVGLATRAGADTAAVLLDALRDGRIDSLEAEAVRGCAAAHREIARQLDSIAAAAATGGR